MSRLVSDQALREAFKRGDRAALEVVYREYAPTLYAFVRRKLGGSDPFEVDNMVQEIFLKAFSDKARAGYDGLRPYRNYLLTIAGNLIIDQRRKQSRVQLADSDDDRRFELPDAPEAAPEQITLAREVERLTEEFAGELDQATGHIFEARFVRGLSVEACAAELGVSEYRIKRDEKRLRRLFFEHMQRVGYFDGYSRQQLLSVARSLLAASALAAAASRGTWEGWS